MPTSAVAGMTWPPSFELHFSHVDSSNKHCLRNTVLSQQTSSKTPDSRQRLGRPSASCVKRLPYHSKQLKESSSLQYVLRAQGFALSTFATLYDGLYKALVVLSPHIPKLAICYHGLQRFASWSDSPKERCPAHQARPEPGRRSMRSERIEHRLPGHQRFRRQEYHNIEQGNLRQGRNLRSSRADPRYAVSMHVY